MPNVEPWHVNPELPPHVASVETAVADTAGAVDVVAVAVAVDATVDVNSLPPLAERYQFVEGSPRHSPTVTALNPLDWSC